MKKGHAIGFSGVAKCGLLITEQKRIEREEKFLAEFGSVLASTLEYPQTVASIASLTAHHFGDWCAVDLVQEDGRVQRVEVASADPAKADIAEGSQAV